MKLGIGILLALGGLIGTAGGVVGLVIYFRSCLDSPLGSFEAVCGNSVALMMAAWLVGGVILGVVAIAAIRSRTRPWVRRGHRLRDARHP